MGTPHNAKCASISLSHYANGAGRQCHATSCARLNAASLARHMRIALISPYCWPQVRRGSERFLHDASHWLAARGHTVSIITSARGPQGGPPLGAARRREEQDGRVRRIILPQSEPLGAHLRACNHLHRFAFQVCDEILAGDYDVVHCLNYHEAWGALRARRRGGRHRIIYQSVGVPTWRYFWRIPLDGWMFRRVVRDADVVISVSRRAADLLWEDFGRRSVLLRAPTDLRPYLAQQKPPPDGRLRILFTGDLTEPRKGAVLLARAFARVRAAFPGAVLEYSGASDDAVVAAVRAATPAVVFEAITFHGVGDVAALPELYARATVFVSPAVWEAQGMVLVEALAAGTPVVGCNHAGVPDIISTPAIGRMFEPGPIVDHVSVNDIGLANAILAVAALAALPETAARCRAHAGAFGWDLLGPHYEEVLLGTARPGG